MTWLWRGRSKPRIAPAIPGGRAFADSLGLALAVHVLGAYPAPSLPGTGLTAAQLARITDYVEAHLDGELSLRELSDVLAISASHLKATFKRSTGLAVHEYIVYRRVTIWRAVTTRPAAVQAVSRPRR
jgi:AraC family transcriptional regulator